MQTPAPPKKNRFHFFVQIVAQCSATNEKSFFRLVEIYSFKNEIFFYPFGYKNEKDAQCSKRIEDFFFGETFTF